jgi:hypothetical protein
MMNEPVFKIIQEETVVDRRLSKEEIRLALQEIKRLSFMEWPNADATVLPIEITNNEWHRQKIPGERFRSIFKIVRESREITLLAILVRDKDTYAVVVKRLYIEES